MYMQRILFILALAVALFFTADKAYAQRDLPGQTGVQFTTGGVDRFLSWKSGGERHYFTSLAFTRTNRLSALGGFETVNWGTSLLPDGASVTNGDSFIYGGGLTAAFDVWLTDQIILLMQVKERALFGTDAGNFHTQIGLGVRLIIN